jgi:sorting nexin-1/2
VTYPRLTKTTFKDFFEYPITGEDESEEIEIFRRFSLFEKFRNALVTKFPGVFIPPLPEKVLTGNSDEDRL